MTFKTIWQPVPKWDVPVKELELRKTPRHDDELKRDRSANKKEADSYKRWLRNGRI